MSLYDDAVELMHRVHTFVTRLMNDPALIRKNSGDFQTAIRSWEALHKMMPDIVKLTGDELKKLLIAQTLAAPHERLKFANEWPKEPPPPAANATEMQLMEYQRALGKYNRMFEMYSKIMMSSHDMKKSIIGNMR